MTILTYINIWKYNLLYFYKITISSAALSVFKIKRFLKCLSIYFITLSRDYKILEELLLKLGSFDIFFKIVSKLVIPSSF